MRVRSLRNLAAALAAASAFMASATTAKEDTVQLITVDPGHFHAALVQKFMLPGVDPVVHVFAPAGPDLDQHLARIASFNGRKDEPTRWVEQVHTDGDYLAQAIRQAQGGNRTPAQALESARRHVVVLSGNNARKSEYITRLVDAGLNVLADKPMVIRPEEMPALEAAFAAAKQKGVLLYDIMTERFEITTILQRELSLNKELFGTLEAGTPDNPSVSKISVHNFSKVVAGAQLLRPQWFFDPEQQGAGIVDVTTHLVDLVQWEAFPDVALRRSDVTVLSARRWPTKLTLAQFSRLTGAGAFPDFLSRYVSDGVLLAPSNGEFTYRLKGIHARISVTWDFEAPPGAGDTHFSVMRGTKASLTIKQGADQGYKPVLYVERAAGVSAAEHEKALQAAIVQVAKKYPGVDVRREEGHFVVVVPDKYHVGHEAHFTQVTENFLKYLRAGKLPDWEVPNMLTKYATIMQAYELSR
jgi:predicted dehydrogenase